MPNTATGWCIQLQTDEGGKTLKKNRQQMKTRTVQIKAVTNNYYKIIVQDKIRIYYNISRSVISL